MFHPEHVPIQNEDPEPIHPETNVNPIDFTKSKGFKKIPKLNLVVTAGDKGKRIVKKKKFTRK